MEVVFRRSQMGQMQLFGSTDSVNKNIIFPLDERWWPTMEQWIKSPVCAADTETRPLGRGKKDALNPWKNAPRLFQIGVQMPDETVNVLMVDTDQWPNYQESRFFAVFKSFIESPTRWVIYQNGMFDLLCLRVWYGWRPQAIFDTFIASNLQWAGLPVKNSLGAQCDRYGIEIDKTEQSSDWGAPVLTASQLNYAARDVEVLFPLARNYQRYLTAQGQEEVMWLEMRFLCALVEMEFNGLPLDVPKLHEYWAAYQAAYDTYYQEVNAEWKRLSPRVMGTIIERSDLGVDNKTQVGQFLQDLTGEKSAKADKQTLLQLADRYPILKTLSLCRTLKKSLDKFSAIDKAKRKHPTGLWVVSGAYKQFSKSAGDDDGEGGDDYGAGTGRTGSGAGPRGAYLAPNLQNIPAGSKLPKEIQALGLRSIRDCFRLSAADNSGITGCFYVHDLAAAHARIAASLSLDQLMKEIYDTDLDAHAITVTKLIKYLEGYDPATMTVTPEDVIAANELKKRPDLQTPLQSLLIRLRDVGKNFYYGCLNDGGAFVLYRLFQSSNLDISMENCEAALAEYFKLYFGLGTFLQAVRDDCMIPPLDLPEDIKTLAKRSSKSNWHKFIDGNWYYRVQPVVNGKPGRKVNRKVRIKPMKAGGTIALGPKPADVLSAIWLGMEATAMKQAGATVYEWLCAHPEIEFYLGAITHDELDGWSLRPEPEAAAILVSAMDGHFGEMIKPIPPGPPTKPESVIVSSWSDK
jgi:hypothetical protein